MSSEQILIVLATAIASATPLVFAVIGETISERAGVINLSAEGTIMFCAMVGFAAALATGSVWLGFIAAAVVGALIALIVAFNAITLRQSQIAVGFVLALLFSDLSSFLGVPIVRIPGPTVPAFPLPLLSELPIVGRLLFSSDVVVYASYVLIVLTWVFFYRTRAGLTLRAIGEQPNAAFARGADVVRLRYLYTLIGGALMGIAGAAFSLDFKAGWSFRHTGGYGWIALAIVIFGGWNPLRAAFGAYLFGVLQSLASVAQDQFQGVPTQVLNVAPFALMIVFLVFTSAGWLDRLLMHAPAKVRRRVLQALHTAPPAALGKPFVQD
ncbi:MAG: ABC transporter permease [Thermoflexales bacterium]|nr:ABC transporter permease [Thermoflexales bacterium]MCS7323783.1 ABC transporter permease [Thermoflexales bacterium]MCX7939771.1 ABC transporter permease [Thermoflexales bacterium]MDW8053891.1 ABC transporter permease [Anaerolineae bacterium]MDW8292432.1 ABC transporter permease [Anaerolineae bacterium]